MSATKLAAMGLAIGFLGIFLLGVDVGLRLYPYIVGE